MKRRDFSLAATSLGLLPLASPSHAQARMFTAGKDFVQLGKPAPVDSPAGKIEVVEFFSYNCPHCAAFEPRLETWIKTLPAQVVFKRVPVAFVGNDVETKQRLYYTLEAMGKVDEHQLKLFQAIHSQRQPLFGDAAILAWSEKQPGLDAKKFAELFKSFSVSGKVKRATQLQNDYQVGGVPALGVAGRWYVDGELAGNLDRALQITDYLISEARKG
ncbi:thiol:disulfide interchange protein DsbA/DsbL [Variovorax sp. J22G21]|uniref:thiol:disulfide interchange protein DsbA/DsbL n=1 Tax=Variovorax fucosicus TaxID=3053517 RepID=UPI002574EF29|nr:MULTISPECIES: thiol:disulfide interchange protein DsbA/DsbL [unclassified Variovorax]MDM0039641.1 thiol:disulfide interchange protein DsbA/DsbL [Variovorax sp. J22R193]MDM0054749.1 thiol:disulfide interchange protein DsbA/DsbL [Variovorax sp. J22G47]MDM0064416.1 thiol:disulfide interchange protein DsbA/DsbL [Variovorax sp. J22G21]